MRSRPTPALPLAALALLGLLALSSCSLTIGSGTIKSESRNVSGFTKVDLPGDGELLIEQTGNESLTIEAEDNVLPLLTSKVDGGTLTLDTKKGANVRHTKPITYQLAVKDLTGIDVSGSGSVTSTKITTAKLTTDISGSGNVTLAGSADDQVLTISGSGSFNADNLLSKTVSADISGSGDASINVSAALKVTISGSGNLTYSGDPTVTKDISGSGALTKK